MAIVYPDFMTISKLRTPATEGEFHLLNYLQEKLDSSFEIFFNPFLDGDRPDIIILKKNCGAVIIEVKDWCLSSYTVEENNRWFVYTKDNKKQPIRSPQQQAFQYKKNLFDSHLPILGNKEILDKRFFNVINSFVYFHGSNHFNVELLYTKVLSELKAQIDELNKQKKCGSIPHDIYEKKNEYLLSQKRKINRDKNMSFSENSIYNLLKKIEKMSKNILFSEEIYDEFKRRLSPSDYFYSQGIKIEFDKKQQKYTQSVDGFSKIKGVAGCGKTSIIAARAINAYLRHGNVLILTFNITLKQLIRDKISHINYHSEQNADANHIEITTYHSFFIAMLNNLNKELKIPDSNSSKEEKELFWDKEFKKDSYFKDEATIRYKSIFIDEIQDYEKEWIKILRDYFLEQGGEMVLFGDQAQNIYQREDDPLRKSIINGFRRWVEFTKTYRLTNLNKELVSSFDQFQKIFLKKKYNDLDTFDIPNAIQNTFLKDLKVLKNYHCYDKENIDEVSQTINNYIKKGALIPNDIVIISSQINILRTINDFFSKQEKTMISFITEEEEKIIKEREKGQGNKQIELKKIERRKKNYFVQNSGVIKISTIHSFKGMESKTVFCILCEHDNPELVYTAITRAKENLVIFDVKNSKYAPFFKRVYEAL